MAQQITIQLVHALLFFTKINTFLHLKLLNAVAKEESRGFTWWSIKQHPPRRRHFKTLIEFWIEEREDHHLF